MEDLSAYKDLVYIYPYGAVNRKDLEDGTWFEKWKDKTNKELMEMESTLDKYSSDNKQNSNP